MKKAFAFTIILFMASGFVLKAQTEKGKYFVGTFNRLELNIGSEKTKYGGEVDENSKYSYWDFNLEPKIGYTVIDNMPIGIFMYVDYYGEKDKSDEDKDRSCEFAVGPFIRYYFADLQGFKPYAEAEVGFGFYREKYKSGSEDDWNKYKESYRRFKLGGGATYFFNENVGVDLFLGFLNEAWTHKEESDGERSDAEKTKYISNEFLMQMGIVVMLGK